MDELLVRIWHNLLERVSGPFSFRLLIQPSIALFFGILDGIKDAREGKPAYFWSLFVDRIHRRLLLHKGWHSIAKVFILAVGLDVIYQLFVLHFVYPGEALFVGFLLALMPYLIVRGPANRLARTVAKWRRRS